MSTPARAAALAYGLAAYALFFATVFYAIGFVANLGVPKGIDGGVAASMPVALAVNLSLLGLFALQHSIMARPAFKRWWTRFVPHSVERSTYVVLACAALVLLFVFWIPMPAPVWTVTAEPAATILLGLSLAGWTLVFASTFLISHTELFGLKQVMMNWRGRGLPDPTFRTPLFYRVVRHPLYLGFLIAFWSTPAMTLGHLLFAAATTAYILIAIQLEEHDLVGLFGDRYRDYRRRVGMLLPRLSGSSSEETKRPAGTPAE
jgi:protein-S-isoprenylcysteine O-methyltransferase Ste14